MEKSTKQESFEYNEYDNEWITKFAEIGTGKDMFGKRINSYKCKQCGTIHFSPTGSAIPLVKHLVKEHGVKVVTMAGVLIQ